LLAFGLRFARIFHTGSVSAFPASPERTHSCSSVDSG
jgi:hypothetical protein